jgi:methyl-accepting chemotaxis protein
MARLSIRSKIMLVFMLLFTAALAAIFVWFYQFAAGVAMSNLREDLMTSAKTSAGLIDPADFAQAQADPNSAAAARITDDLDLILNSNDNVSAVYVMVPDSTGPGQFTIVLDVYDGTDGSDYISVNETLDAADVPEIQAALQEPTSSPELREDEYGLWLSGYAPIQDAGGKTIGIAGVDMMGEDVQYIRQQILIVSLVVFVLALVAVFLAAYFLSGAITRSMNAITGAAESLEKGVAFDPESLASVAKGSDEVGRLARVFSQMAVQVQAREQKLKQEIQKLRIEIDDKKRAQDVSQIVDTEYFKDLKQKAKGLRDKKE